MKRGMLILVAIAAIGWTGSSEAASCPANWMNVDDVGYPSYGPSATLGSGEDGGMYVPWAAGTPCVSGCYDLPNGWLESRGYNTLYGDPGTRVAVEDDYWVEGPPGADPIAFEIVFLVHAEICSGGSGFATFGLPSSTSRDFPIATSGDTEGSIPITRAPLEHFSIDAAVWAIGGRYDGESDVRGVIRFRGVPAGYVVRSCQNYDLPTPARPATWGGVKALYR